RRSRLVALPPFDRLRRAQAARHRSHPHHRRQPHDGAPVHLGGARRGWAVELCGGAGRIAVAGAGLTRPPPFCHHARSRSPYLVMPAKAGIALRLTPPTRHACEGGIQRLSGCAEGCIEQSNWSPASAGAHPVRDALVLVAIQRQERSVAFDDRVTFLLRGQEKSNQKRRPPRLALAGHRATAPALPQLGHPCPRHARQVREPGPGFSTGHPALAKRSRHPCRLPLRGLSTPPHRRTGAPGRAAGLPGPHSVVKLGSRSSSAEPHTVVALLLLWLLPWLL